MTDIIFVRNVNVFVLLFFFLRKGHKEASSPWTVNHCWKAKACVLGHYTENCLTEKTLHLRAPSQNYLPETAPDWSKRQCYFPRTHSCVNDLWPAWRIWRTNQSTSRIDIIFRKGKVPVETTWKVHKTPSQDLNSSSFTLCRCRRGKVLVVVPQRRANSFLTENASHGKIFITLNSKVC